MARQNRKSCIPSCTNLLTKMIMRTVPADPFLTAKVILLFESRAKISIFYFNLMISLHLVVGFFDLKSCLMALAKIFALPSPLGRVYCWLPMTMVSVP